jgi:hypothetical protein
VKFPPVPEHAILYATREDWSTVQDEFEGWSSNSRRMKVQLLPDGPLPWLARSLRNTDAVNLLQGEFARTKDYSASLRRWRTAAALAGGLLCVHLAAEAVQIQHAKHESAALDTVRSPTNIPRPCPRVPMQDARRQMQTQLDRIRHSGPGAQQFLAHAAGPGTATAGTPKTTIDALSFHEGIPGYESHRTQSRGGIANIAGHRQARHDRGNSILGTGGQRHRSAPAAAAGRREGRAP